MKDEMPRSAMNVFLELLNEKHESRLLEAVRRSAALHANWVSPPNTVEAFRAWVEKCRAGTNISYVAINADAELIGCVTLSEIVRGCFQSAYIGFYAFTPFEGRGLMKSSLALVLSEAFTTHGLHRLEANIQPANLRSKELVRSLGFRLEGYSPRYLRVGALWCDHERFAITVEEHIH